MNILVLNCGSSSVKYKLIEIKANNVLAEGGIEKIGLPEGRIPLAEGIIYVSEAPKSNKVVEALGGAENVCLPRLEQRRPLRV